MASRWLTALAFAALCGFGAPAAADTIRADEVSPILETCSANQYRFTNSVHRIGEAIQRQSTEYHPKTGTITYQSTRVWDRDIRMLMHHFSVDFNAVSQGGGATVARCNAVINYYSRCVDDLHDNVVADVSVRRPTTGCLGKLYDTYHLTADDYYHGR
ncbi:exported protein of unknown function [Magnetospirillum gryphiswaldense MSR-1 v2]|uniref:Secreted protein n=1 Tax=Magnetospirillum gryphiswaldense (strain DSM 6361 / JCM 21280 / NBRC 15271 / MSR-1) TaxID=431944 RepID=V6F728_MAGGM|nr:hypothetical protein [Magnetospirillum gryphiswaldense]CDL00273.1 exported protein of unknown function [Magnetospirillum gryphiswaldense MSR-1 v2]